MGNERSHRQRSTYLLLIGTGIFLLFHKLFGFSIILALFLIALGIYLLVSSADRKGYVLLAVGLIIFIGNHFMLILSLVLVSLGFFYLKSKQVHADQMYNNKYSLLESIKWDKEPWVLRNSSMWNMIGEINMDLSLAIVEDKEVTVVLQGLIGDIDITVPEYMGVSIQTYVFFGQNDVEQKKETGVMNKIVWQSPAFETSENKVKLIVSYIVGDIDIKVH